MGLVIGGAAVCAPDGVLAPGWLSVGDDGTIGGLGAGAPPAEVRAAGTSEIDGAGLVLAPGFIDLHVHGGDGAEAMDGDPEAILRLARFHARHGVTGIVPTTWAATEGAIRAACEAIASVAGPVDGGATILGAHLEGPWINPSRCGAQDPSHIRPPNLAEAERLLAIPFPAPARMDGPAPAGSARSEGVGSAAPEGAVRPADLRGGAGGRAGPVPRGGGAGGRAGEGVGSVVRLVALAPEMVGADRVIAACQERGVAVSAGHTEATYDEMVGAVAAGVRHVTHTYNAMPGLGHRDPGTVGAALALPELRCELIADGIHVHPAAMAVLARAKGPDGVVLVSDATRAAGLPEGMVSLGGRPAHHCGGAVRLPDGRLAGSALTLDRAVATFAAATGWGWDLLWRAAAANAAAALGLGHRKGTLAAGYDADLVLVDPSTGSVHTTIAGGRIVYTAAGDGG